MVELRCVLGYVLLQDEGLYFGQALWKDKIGMEFHRHMFRTPGDHLIFATYMGKLFVALVCFFLCRWGESFRIFTREKIKKRVWYFFFFVFWQGKKKN
jgi:hypothetical protein